MIDGTQVFVINGALNETTLSALRKECDALTEKLIRYDPALMGAAIDPLEDASVSETHPARTQSNEYFHLRWGMGEYLLADERGLVEDVLLSRLPSILLRILKRSSDGNMNQDLRLFNEHYIVKSVGSGVSFRWHRDVDEQLTALSAGDLRPYWSMWCPLDDCSASNGTIYFPKYSDITYIDYEDVKINYSNHAISSKKRPLAKLSDDSDDCPTVDEGGIPICVSSGCIVMFSSTAWHRSSVNESTSSRRVLYAQYSEGPIALPWKQSSELLPLNLAIQCNLN